MTGLMVRDYLLSLPPPHCDFVMNIWRNAVVEVCKANGDKYPTWNDFMNSFSKYKRAGLVIFDRYEPAPDLTGEPIMGRRRSYYKLNLALAYSPAWRNVIQFLYNYPRKI